MHYVHLLSVFLASTLYPNLNTIELLDFTLDNSLLSCARKQT